LREEFSDDADAPSRPGRLQIGLGDHFETEKLEAYPPGTVIVLTGGTPHFHWARSGDT
jgi:hypothetical protein